MRLHDGIIPNYKPDVIVLLAISPLVVTVPPCSYKRLAAVLASHPPILTRNMLVLYTTLPRACSSCFLYNYHHITLSAVFPSPVT